MLKDIREYLALALILCLPSWMNGQVYADRRINGPQPNQTVSILSKDNRNRLVAATGTTIWAFDGSNWLDFTPSNFTGKLLAYYLIEGTNNEFLLTTRAIYRAWSQPGGTKTELFYTFPSAIDRFYFNDATLVVRDVNDVMHYVSLEDKKVIELPYLEKPPHSVFISDEQVFLMTDKILSWDKVNRSYRDKHRNLPPDTYFTVQADTYFFLVNSDGDLNRYNPKTNTWRTIDNIDGVRSDGYHADGKLYFPHRSGGLIIYDIDQRKTRRLDRLSGLCTNEIEAIYIDDQRFIWTSSPLGICLSEYRMSVLADRESGLNSNDISSISFSNNDLFITTHAGGVYTLKSSGRLSALSFPSPYSMLSVNASLHFNHGLHFIGTSEQGLLMYTIAGGIAPVDTISSQAHISSLSTATKNDLYIGTYNQGLWHIHVQNDTISEIKQLFTDQIESVVDVIGILDGDAVVADRQNLYFLYTQDKKLEVLHSFQTDEKINDIALWNGWVYIATDKIIKRVPVSGLGSVSEEFNIEDKTLGPPYTSIHTTPAGFFLSNNTKTVRLAESYFNSPGTHQPLRSYPFQIRKNALIQTTDGLVAGTNQGVLKVAIDTQPYSRAHLYIKSILVNGKEIQLNDSPAFDPDQNNWQFYLHPIAPENPSDLFFKWKLFKGNTLVKEGASPLPHISIPELQPGHYRLQAFAQGRTHISSTLNYSFTINSPLTSSPYFTPISILIGIFLVGILSFLISRLITIRQRRRLNLLERERNNADWQHKALQLQMNPHMLSNALNSVQGLIGEDKLKAISYIAKLGKLMRENLIKSREEWISIAHEVELLETYLAMEKLLYNFKFSIDSSAIDQEIKIPSHMIQPLVENAVNHGVSKLGDEGEIQIKFEYAGRKINCTVRDNGPGLSESPTDQNHRSISTTIINERIELYRQHNILVSPLEFPDVQDGCVVQIGLPYKQNDL